MRCRRWCRSATAGVALSDTVVVLMVSVTAVVAAAGLTREVLEVAAAGAR